MKTTVLGNVQSLRGELIFTHFHSMNNVGTNAVSCTLQALQCEEQYLAVKKRTLNILHGTQRSHAGWLVMHVLWLDWPTLNVVASEIQRSDVLVVQKYIRQCLQAAVGEVHFFWLLL